MASCPWPGLLPSVSTKLIKAFNGSGKRLNSEHTQLSLLWSLVLTPVDLWSFRSRPWTCEHLSLLAPSILLSDTSLPPGYLPVPLETCLTHWPHPLPCCRWPVSDPVIPYQQYLFPLQPVVPWEQQSLTLFPVASETNTGST